MPIQKPETETPHGHRDRGLTNDQLSKKAPAKSRPGETHDPEAARLDAEKTFEPDRDGSGS